MASQSTSQLIFLSRPLSCSRQHARHAAGHLNDLVQVLRVIAAFVPPLRQQRSFHLLQRLNCGHAGTDVQPSAPDEDVACGAGKPSGMVTGTRPIQSSPRPTAPPQAAGGGVVRSN